MKQREVADNENTRWTCAQAFNMTEEKGPSPAEVSLHSFLCIAKRPRIPALPVFGSTLRNDQGTRPSILFLT